MSMAKVILLECCNDYDWTRGVPFASYYKIKLYHWYANYKKKKVVLVTDLMMQTEEFTLEVNYENEWKKEKFSNALAQLSDIERKILIRICEGFTHQQIAEELRLSKKTILNKKYIAMQKVKNHITIQG